MKPKKNKKENHHYIPQFYLSYWNNHNNKVWAYYKDSSKIPNPNQVHTKKILSIKNLYSIEDSQAIEAWLSGSPESSVGTVLKKISKGEPISNDDEDIIKFFLALLMTRHPRKDRFSKELANMIIESIPKNALAQTLPFQLRYSLIDKLNFHLQLRHIAPELLESWSFITSDTPFVQTIDITTRNRYYYYPLTPYVIAFLFSIEPNQRELVIHDPDNIAAINRNLADSSDNILIANNKEIFNAIFLK
ncbi:MAG: DUF4238 domain-containing protein [Chloroflexi bacterium]|nr:MAG: DUF4238 domain-containing protein [Chloroflexota bacterium]MBL1196620.1 DUF4238 domain-containing protein [Chloroflexota bacterium]NOH13913.1 DUF4238 domain-containing protein [Chloroflexota bacterium]